MPVEAGTALASDRIPAVVIDGPAPPVPPAVISRDAERRATVRATRLTEEISVDGLLDERVYQTVPATQNRDALQALFADSPPDAVIFMSPSAVRNFVALGFEEFADRFGQTVVAVIGAVTAAAAAELGIPSQVQPAVASAEALVEVIGAHFGVVE